jgi:hypothetical protein
MSHAIERAPTGRAKCRACGRPIARGTLRLGERLPNPFDEKGGEMTHWFHLPCAAFRRPEPLIEALGTATDPIDERDTLEREAHLGVTHRRLPRVNTVERAPSGRAACRACRAPIEKGVWRISLLYYEDGRFVPSGFIHLACAAGYLETTAILPRLRHFTPALSPDEVEEVERALSTPPAG